VRAFRKDEVKPGAGIRGRREAPATEPRHFLERGRIMSAVVTDDDYHVAGVLHVLAVWGVALAHA
jgi:hypothetical protein